MRPSILFITAPFQPHKLRCTQLTQGGQYPSRPSCSESAALVGHSPILSTTLLPPLITQAHQPAHKAVRLLHHRRHGLVLAHVAQMLVEQVLGANTGSVRHAQLGRAQALEDRVVAGPAQRLGVWEYCIIVEAKVSANIARRPAVSVTHSSTGVRRSRTE